MKPKIFVLISLFLLLVFVVLLYGIGGQPMVAAMKQLTTVVSRVGAMILGWIVTVFGPLYVGAVARNAISKLENRFGYVVWWQEIILAGLTTVIALVAWMALLPFMADSFELFRKSLTWPTGTYDHWNGYFESPPIWWGLWSGFLAMLAYTITAGMIKDGR